MLLLVLPVQAESLIVKVSGMDCAGCEPQLVQSLENLDFLGPASADFERGEACAVLEGPMDPEALFAAVQALGYGLAGTVKVENCPDYGPPTPKDPWAGAAGLDVVLISRGEQVELAPVEGHFTVVDFGAPWCSPCYEAAELLGDYLREHPDVAVRVVSLEGEPEVAFDLPVAQQHLAGVPGIPWFIVYSPKGRVIYRGNDAAAAIAKIEKKR